MSWIEDVFGRKKAVIGMVHFPPLPGTPLYQDGDSIAPIIARVQEDIEALQAGGLHGVMFCNENDRPYVMQADPVVVASMARVIGESLAAIRVPFGVDVLWDAKAAIAVAKATGGKWVREVFTGTYDSDMGHWDTQCGDVLRYRKYIDAADVRLLFNISAEFASPLGKRSLKDVARSVAFSSLADAVCVSGAMTGSAVDLDELRRVKEAVPDLPVFANTGTRADNVASFLGIADGVLVGTHLKREGITWNPVDPKRVEVYMRQVDLSLQG